MKTAGYSLFFAALLAGCGSVPPATVMPAVSLPDQFSRQTPGAEARASGRWWHRFDDLGLARAVDLVVSQNLDLEQAKLRVEQSRALADRVRLRSLPRVDLGASASSNRASLQTAQAAAPGFDRTTREVGVSVSASWELDLFGRNRAAQDAEQARVRVAQSEWQGLALTLSADTARRVLELRGVQEQLRLADEAMATEQALVEVVEARLRGGQVTQADLLRARAQLEATGAARTRLQAARSDALLALSLLLSDTPASVAALVGVGAIPSASGLAAFATTPAAVLSRRPDVMRARQQLEAASADLAATAAERFPKVNLLASVGLAAASLSSLGSSDAVLAAVAPSVSWRVIDFGDLQAQVAERKASEQIALAGYRQAMVNAFSDAETALNRVAEREEELRAAELAVAAQQQAWEQARLMYEKGVADLTVALEARRLLNTLQRDASTSRQSLAIASVEAVRATALGQDQADMSSAAATLQGRQPP